ncbi:hypothetical protein [Dongia sp.]|uniref:hypothetical protein n=1 Tax=Dongia sp. TaxID=1977262 RepID=UPI0035B3931B
MGLHASGFNGHCDVCGTLLPVPALDDASARKFLRLHGWECGQIYLCHSCVEKRDAGNEGALLLIKQRLKQKATDGG